MSPQPEHPRPALTADVVALAGTDDLRVLLVRRRFPPCQGSWALPGGFVEPDEEPVAAAIRELAEETGVEWAGPLDLVGVYGEPGRDPRGWTVTVAYMLDAGSAEPPTARGGDDAEVAAWFPVAALPPLAFDHDRILGDALGLLGG